MFCSLGVSPPRVRCLGLAPSACRAHNSGIATARARKGGRSLLALGCPRVLWRLSGGVGDSMSAAACLFSLSACRPAACVPHWSDDRRWLNATEGCDEDSYRKSTSQSLSVIFFRILVRLLPSLALTSSPLLHAAHART